MKFLVDNSVSHVVADRLSAESHDAVHVKAYEMADAPDERILERATVEERIIITYDLDFPRLLALTDQTAPSLIVYRRIRDPEEQVRLLLRNLSNISDPLVKGAICMLEPERIRVRALPLGRDIR